MDIEYSIYALTIKKPNPLSLYLPQFLSPCAVLDPYKPKPKPKPKPMGDREKK